VLGIWSRPSSDWGYKYDDHVGEKCIVDHDFNAAKYTDQNALVGELHPY